MKSRVQLGLSPSCGQQEKSTDKSRTVHAWSSQPCCKDPAQQPQLPTKGRLCSLTRRRAKLARCGGSGGGGMSASCCGWGCDALGGPRGTGCPAGSRDARLSACPGSGGGGSGGGGRRWLSSRRRIATGRCCTYNPLQPASACLAARGARSEPRERPPGLLAEPTARGCHRQAPSAPWAPALPWREPSSPLQALPLARRATHSHHQIRAAGCRIVQIPPAGPASLVGSTGAPLLRTPCGASGHLPLAFRSHKQIIPDARRSRGVKAVKSAAADGWAACVIRTAPPPQTARPARSGCSRVAGSKRSAASTAAYAGLFA